MAEADDILGRVTEIVDKHFGPHDAETLASQSKYAIEVWRPTSHSSKAEFQEEVAQVERVLEQVSGLINALLDAFGDKEDRKQATKNIITKIDASGRARRRKKPVETPIDLARNVVADTGLGVTTIFLLIDLRTEIFDLKEELELHRQTFWSSASRPPDHYARTIALRLGREVIKRTGALPTFGTARDGGHPSTAYGKALEEIFEVLEITTKVRHPAKWAIKHLGENPHVYSPGNALSGPPTIYDAKPAKPINYVDQIVDALSYPS